MSSYIALRLGQSVLVMLILSYCIFALMALMPGDPIQELLMTNPKATSEDIARIMSQYGLDKSITERYWDWLTAAVQGDFGVSRFYRLPASEVLWDAIKNTLMLVGMATVLSIVIAIPLGVWTATRHRTWVDYLVSTFSFVGLSTPAFWMGLMLILAFSVGLGWLPSGGSGEAEGGGFWIKLQHMILPTISLTLISVAGHSRYVRGAMLEVLRQDYIRTAKAKGASGKRVVWKHALRNALIPVTTIIALDIGFLLSGATITESVFAWPGMGRVSLEALMGNDYNVAMICFMVITATALLANLLADLVYSWLDPRIDYRKGRHS